MSDEGVRIGEAAALYGLAPSTLRWWEKQGVLGSPARRGQQRLYREQDLRRIGLAYLCHVTGKMPLDRAATAASDKSDTTAWQRTIAEQVELVERQLEQMEAARDYLQALLRCDHADPVQCPSLDVELNLRTPRGRLPHRNLTDAARAARDSRHRRRDATADRDETPIVENESDENVPTAGHPCRACGQPVTQAPRGRPRLYCSHACQQRAYRTRRRHA